MPNATQESNVYADYFRAQASASEREPAWLRTLRQTAIERFNIIGFPTIREEAWRYTNVAPISKAHYPIATTPGSCSPEQIRSLSFDPSNPIQLVFVDGFLDTTLSTMPAHPGLTLQSLKLTFQTHPELLENHLGRITDNSQSFTALQTAFFQDGAFIHAARGCVIKDPIHLLYVTTQAAIMTAPRILIVTEEDAQLTVIESYASTTDKPYFTNTLTEVALGRNARLDHYKVQCEALSAFHISTLYGQQARSSVFNSHVTLAGGALVRNNINVIMKEEATETTLNGLFLLSGKQHADTHTFVDHAKPGGISREYYKGILDDQSRGVFDGHVSVRKDAQKTDAVQTNKNLLLSDKALINTKPELKIYANDVKCKHGATIGQLSAESIFYLRSRGIDLASARRLLIYAFASEMINPIPLAPLREDLTALLLQKFRELESTHV